jgi:hypothetical protein
MMGGGAPTGKFGGIKNFFKTNGSKLAMGAGIIASIAIIAVVSDALEKAISSI